MKKDLEKPINIIISSKGFGKTYYEFKKLIKENAIHNDKVVDKAKRNEMLYKSRIEKALKYIEKVETFAMIDKINILSITTLKKILQGVDGYEEYNFDEDLKKEDN